MHLTIRCCLCQWWPVYAELIKTQINAHTDICFWYGEYLSLENTMWILFFCNRTWHGSFSEVKFLEFSSELNLGKHWDLSVVDNGVCSV